MQDWRLATFFKNRCQHRCFPQYTVYMLDLIKDCYNCFSLSIEKHLNLPQFFISYWEKFLELIKFITIVLIYCLWIFLSTFSVFLNDYFFKWLAYKSLLSRFSVLINYMCDLTIFFPYPAVFDVFHGSGYLRSRFFRVCIQDLVPGFRNSPTLVHIFL